MASQLRFEGGELEELLERVRTEVGPEARIVAANRIRQGGIAGFFAREGYEVVVDADADADGGSHGAGRGLRGRRRVRNSNEAADRSPTDAIAATAAPASASVLDLVEEVNEIEREQVIDLADPAPPTVSTERADFGTMLANLTRELDEEEASMPTIVDEGPVSPSAHYRRVTAEPSGAAGTADATAAPAPAVARAAAPTPSPALPRPPRCRRPTPGCSRSGCRRSSHRRPPSPATCARRCVSASRSCRRRRCCRVRPAS